MTQTMVMQLRREIDILKFCQHPNLVQLIEIFEGEETTYIVQEFLAGKDLHSLLEAKDYNIEEKQVKTLIVQIASAIQYLHSLGIIHRDLKLENVVMSEDSDRAVAKVIDFGLSKTIGPKELTSGVLGTVGYAAPEVLRSKPYGKSCDVWSLGCIAYALFSGALPFDYQTKEQTIKETIRCNLDFEVPGWEGRSEGAKDFIRFVIVRDEEKRPSIEQVLAHPFLN
uniref:Protein kinase domain-containing protein n=1 Tax=Strombidium rassoulzadegani TaxID=1082188 RepID=A0A7S3CSJ4_9SPIT|mmetsp:Transcript_6443/g.10938  ORF Transcript_6443/g.10938 Transcript_6443/m.10938 type:complete len:225 (+) Transcript_6443:537-1211(+)